ncbi:hypothetical protein BN1221_04793 [Brenneria goodwinii]|uniref:Uncharacterized protein n=1 Tax=Brenneria goodwinii TaxID=1109412 RepID=A0A0G4K2W6_9GAMM|nr:hypothetical protein BN1221_04793 [Brenneria goodwinii]
MLTMYVWLCLAHQRAMSCATAPSTPGGNSLEPSPGKR